MPLAARKLILFAVVAIATAGCDHVTKNVAVSYLDESGPTSFAGGAVRLVLAQNEGAFLSIGSELPESLRATLFLVLVPIVIMWFCLRFLVGRKVSVPLALGLGLVAGGGFANWADRLVNSGFVTDFVVVRLGPLQTGIFNLADVAVMTGAVLVALVAVRAGNGGAPSSQ